MFSYIKFTETAYSSSDVNATKYFLQGTQLTLGYALFQLRIYILCFFYVLVFFLITLQPIAQCISLRQQLFKYLILKTIKFNRGTIFNLNKQESVDDI
jgi:small-conductance mechanosensitive channel